MDSLENIRIKDEGNDGTNKWAVDGWFVDLSREILSLFGTREGWDNYEIGLVNEEGDSIDITWIDKGVYITLNESEVDISIVPKNVKSPNDILSYTLTYETKNIQRLSRYIFEYINKLLPR